MANPELNVEAGGKKKKNDPNQALPPPGVDEIMGPATVKYLQGKGMSNEQIAQSYPQVDVGPRHGMIDLWNKLTGNTPGPAPTTPAPKTAAAAQTPQSFEQLINPLALQTYYATTIGPLLAQIAGQQHGDINLFNKTMGDAMNRPMPAEAKDVLSAFTPLISQGMQNVSQAQEGAAAAAPAWDQINNILQTVQGGQGLLQQEISRALAEQLLTGGSLSSVAGLGLPGVGSASGQSSFLGIPSLTNQLPAVNPAAAGVSTITPTDPTKPNG